MGNLTRDPELRQTAGGTSICMLGLASAPVWMWALAFVSNRFFDIVKPPPACQLQALKGGPGIVADDFCSSIYSLAFNHLAFWLIRHWL